MENKYFYTTEVEWTGERHGDLRAPVLPNMEVDAPPEFKGHEGVWTPEHLFVASVNSCFMTTFLAIAENSKLNFTSFECNAIGVLDNVDDKFLMTEVVLEPVVTLTDEKDHDRAWRILQRTEVSCLISNSIKSKVSMKPTVKILAVVENDVS